MSFSIHTCKALLNSMFGKTSDFGTLSAVPSIYVALSTTAPAEDGTNVTEPSGAAAYARVSTAASGWNAATTADPAVITNANVVTFPTANGSWGNCTHFALYDASTSGNFLGANSLAVAKTPTSGDTPSFAVDALTISLD